MALRLTSKEYKRAHPNDDDPIIDPESIREEEEARQKWLEERRAEERVQKYRSKENELTQIHHAASTDPNRGGDHNGFLHTLDDPADQAAYQDWYRNHKDILPPDHQNIDLTGLWKHSIKNDQAANLKEKDAGKLREIFERPDSDTFTQNSIYHDGEDHPANGEWVYHDLKNGKTERIWLNAEEDRLVKLYGTDKSLFQHENTFEQDLRTDEFHINDDLFNQLVNVRKLEKYADDPKSWINRSWWYRVTHPGEKREGDYNSYADMITSLTGKGHPMSGQKLVKQFLINRYNEVDQSQLSGLSKWLDRDRYGNDLSYEQFHIPKSMGDLLPSLRSFARGLERVTAGSVAHLAGGLLQVTGKAFDLASIPIGGHGGAILNELGSELIGYSESLDNPELYYDIKGHGWFDTVKDALYGGVDMAVKFAALEAMTAGAGGLIGGALETGGSMVPATLTDRGAEVLEHSGMLSKAGRSMLHYLNSAKAATMGLFGLTEWNDTYHAASELLAQRKRFGDMAGTTPAEKAYIDGLERNRNSIVLTTGIYSLLNTAMMMGIGESGSVFTKVFKPLTERYGSRAVREYLTDAMALKMLNKEGVEALNRAATAYEWAGQIGTSAIQLGVMGAITDGVQGITDHALYDRDYSFHEWIGSVGTSALTGALLGLSPTLWKRQRETREYYTESAKNKEEFLTRATRPLDLKGTEEGVMRAYDAYNAIDAINARTGEGRIMASDQAMVVRMLDSGTSNADLLKGIRQIESDGTLGGRLRKTNILNLYIRSWQLKNLEKSPLFDKEEYNRFLEPVRQMEYLVHTPINFTISPSQILRQERENPRGDYTDPIGRMRDTTQPQMIPRTGNPEDNPNYAAEDTNPPPLRKAYYAIREYLDRTPYFKDKETGELLEPHERDHIVSLCMQAYAGGVRMEEYLTDFMNRMGQEYERTTNADLGMTEERRKRVKELAREIRTATRKHREDWRTAMEKGTGEKDQSLTTYMESVLSALRGWKEKGKVDSHDRATIYWELAQNILGTDGQLMRDIQAWKESITPEGIDRVIKHFHPNADLYREQERKALVEEFKYYSPLEPSPDLSQEALEPMDDLALQEAVDSINERAALAEPGSEEATALAEEAKPILREIERRKKQEEKAKLYSDGGGGIGKEAFYEEMGETVRKVSGGDPAVAEMLVDSSSALTKMNEQLKDWDDTPLPPELAVKETIDDHTAYEIRTRKDEEQGELQFEVSMTKDDKRGEPVVTNSLGEAQNVVYEELAQLFDERGIAKNAIEALTEPVEAAPSETRTEAIRTMGKEKRALRTEEHSVICKPYPKVKHQEREYAMLNDPKRSISDFKNQDSVLTISDNYRKFFGKEEIRKIGRLEERLGDPNRNPEELLDEMKEGGKWEEWVNTFPFQYRLNRELRFYPLSLRATEWMTHKTIQDREAYFREREALLEALILGRGVIHASDLNVTRRLEGYNIEKEHPQYHTLHGKALMKRDGGVITPTGDLDFNGSSIPALVIPEAGLSITIDRKVLGHGLDGISASNLETPDLEYPLARIIHDGLVRKSLDFVIDSSNQDEYDIDLHGGKMRASDLLGLFFESSQFPSGDFRERYSDSKNFGYGLGMLEIDVENGSFIVGEDRGEGEKKRLQKFQANVSAENLDFSNINRIQEALRHHKIDLPYDRMGKSWKHAITIGKKDPFTIREGETVQEALIRQNMVMAGIDLDAPFKDAKLILTLKPERETTEERIATGDVPAYEERKTPDTEAIAPEKTREETAKVVEDQTKNLSEEQKNWISGWMNQQVKNMPTGYHESYPRERPEGQDAASQRRLYEENPEAYRGFQTDNLAFPSIPSMAVYNQMITTMKEAALSINYDDIAETTPEKRAEYLFSLRDLIRDTFTEEMEGWKAGNENPNLNHPFYTYRENILVDDAHLNAFVCRVAARMITRDGLNLPLDLAQEDSSIGETLSWILLNDGRRDPYDRCKPSLLHALSSLATRPHDPSLGMFHRYDSGLITRNVLLTTLGDTYDTREEFLKRLERLAHPRPGYETRWTPILRDFNERVKRDPQLQTDAYLFFRTKRNHYLDVTATPTGKGKMVHGTVLIDETRRTENGYAYQGPHGKRYYGYGDPMAFDEWVRDLNRPDVLDNLMRETRPRHSDSLKMLAANVSETGSTGLRVSQVLNFRPKSFDFSGMKKNGYDDVPEGELFMAIHNLTLNGQAVLRQIGDKTRMMVVDGLAPFSEVYKGFGLNTEAGFSPRFLANHLAKTHLVGEILAMEESRLLQDRFLDDMGCEDAKHFDDLSVSGQNERLNGKQLADWGLVEHIHYEIDNTGRISLSKGRGTKHRFFGFLKDKDGQSIFSRLNRPVNKEETETQRLKSVTASCTHERTKSLIDSWIQGKIDEYAERMRDLEVAGADQNIDPTFDYRADQVVKMVEQRREETGKMSSLEKIFGHDPQKMAAVFYAAQAQLYNQMEINAILEDDPALFKNDSEHTKRISQHFSPGLRFCDDYPDGHFLAGKKTFKQLNIHDVLFTDESHIEAMRETIRKGWERAGETPEEAARRAEETVKGLRGIVATDGQTYITPRHLREMAIRLGQWTPEQEILFEKYMSGDLDPSETNRLLGTVMKCVYVGRNSVRGRTPDGQEVTTGGFEIHKTTYAPMNPDPGSPLYAVMQWMDRNGVGVLQTHSCSKAFGLDRLRLFEDNWKPALGALDLAGGYVREYAWKNIYWQLPLTQHPQRFEKIGIQTLGSVFDTPGATKAHEKMNRAIGALTPVPGVDQILMGGVRPDSRSALADALAKGEEVFLMKGKEINDTLIRGLTHSIGETKGLVSSSVQVSGSGMMAGEPLRLADDHGMTEIALNQGAQAGLFPKGCTFDEAKRFLERARETTGGRIESLTYRIPTSGVRSILKTNLVRLLPDVFGDRSYLPPEAISRLGADFDGDKLYHVSKIYVWKRSDPAMWKEDGKAMEAFENAMSQPKILDSAGEYGTGAIRDRIGYDREREAHTWARDHYRVYEDGRFWKCLKRDIVPHIEIVPLNHPMNDWFDGAMEALSSEGAVLPSLGSVDQGMAEYKRFAEQYGKTERLDRAAIRSAMVGCQKNIGPLALAISMRAEQEHIQGTPLPVRNRFGGLILNDLITHLQAAVDGSKDPFMLSVNFNEYTAPMGAFLLSQGYGESVDLLLANPLVRAATEGTIYSNFTKSIRNQMKAATRFLKGMSPDSQCTTGFARTFLEGILKEEGGAEAIMTDRELLRGQIEKERTPGVYTRLDGAILCMLDDFNQQARDIRKNEVVNSMNKGYLGGWTGIRKALDDYNSLMPEGDTERRDRMENRYHYGKFASMELTMDKLGAAGFVPFTPAFSSAYTVLDGMINHYGYAGDLRLAREDLSIVMESVFWAYGFHKTGNPVLPILENIQDRFRSLYKSGILDPNHWLVQSLFESNRYGYKGLRINLKRLENNGETDLVAKGFDDWVDWAKTTHPESEKEVRQLISDLAVLSYHSIASAHYNPSLFPSWAIDGWDDRIRKAHGEMMRLTEEDGDRMAELTLLHLGDLMPNLFHTYRVENRETIIQPGGRRMRAQFSPKGRTFLLFPDKGTPVPDLMPMNLGSEIGMMIYRKGGEVKARGEGEETYRIAWYVMLRPLGKKGGPDRFAFVEEVSERIRRESDRTAEGIMKRFDVIREEESKASVPEIRDLPPEPDPLPPPEEIGDLTLAPGGAETIAPDEITEGGEAATETTDSDTPSKGRMEKDITIENTEQAVKSWERLDRKDKRKLDAIARAILEAAPDEVTIPETVYVNRANAAELKALREVMDRYGISVDYDSGTKNLIFAPGRDIQAPKRAGNTDVLAREALERIGSENLALLQDPEGIRKALPDEAPGAKLLKDDVNLFGKLTQSGAMVPYLATIGTDGFSPAQIYQSMWEANEKAAMKIPMPDPSEAAELFQRRLPQAIAKALLPNDVKPNENILEHFWNCY